MSARPASTLFTGTDLLQLEHVTALGFEHPSEIRLQSVSTDSRKTEQDSLFVALRGATFDAHNFLTKAVAQGARAAIIERTWAENNPPLLASLVVPRLIVENTTRALGQLARLHRRRFRIPVLAVAGSNGKTTTKDMILAVLSKRYTVLATEGNLNNHVGVPQTILCLNARHEYAVVEIGTNHFGELTYLCDILEPTHGLITNIGNEHLEFFRNLAGVARAEGELVDWLVNHRLGKGVMFLNRDDPRLVKMMRMFGKKISYSLKSRAVEVHATMIAGTAGDRSLLRVTPRGKKPFDCQLGIPGDHNALNALAAAAVGLSLKVPPKQIQRSLSAFRPASNRMESLSIRGVTILNDTYNANPDSVRAALETLRSLEAPGKRIAVLADMLELGTAAEREHRNIARFVKRAGVEYLLTYGPLSRLTHDAATVRFKAHYDQKNVLAEYLSELLSTGDVALIKGSRGMKMEDVVTFVRERLERGSTGQGDRAA
jgi:UDP-N-acetylmuramoyl-tripeptide--D-alanyl-D-alanine ligase